MLAMKYKLKGDHTSFIKHSASRGVTTLLMYMDDNIVFYNDLWEKKAFHQCLNREFETKEFGRFKYFLGIEVTHS